jgi:hypothetical protein
MAQSAFEQLTMASFGTDVLTFNREFNLRSVHFDSVLRDAGRSGLNETDLVTTYLIKLRRPVKFHLDSVLRLRASYNNERVIDGRQPIAFTIREALAETESFALQQVGDLGYVPPASIPTAPAVAADSATVPMDLDAMREEILALRANLANQSKGTTGKGRTRERGNGKCWRCGESRHYRRNCPGKRGDKEREGKEGTR